MNSSCMNNTKAILIRGMLFEDASKTAFTGSTINRTELLRECRSRDVTRLVMTSMGSASHYNAGSRRVLMDNRSADRWTCRMTSSYGKLQGNKWRQIRLTGLFCPLSSRWWLKWSINKATLVHDQLDYWRIWLQAYSLKTASVKLQSKEK